MSQVAYSNAETFSYFSSKTLTFRSVIHQEFICVCCGVRVEIHFFLREYPVGSNPLTEDALQWHLWHSPRPSGCGSLLPWWMGAVSLPHCLRSHCLCSLLVSAISPLPRFFTTAWLFLALCKCLWILESACQCPARETLPGKYGSEAKHIQGEEGFTPSFFHACRTSLIPDTGIPWQPSEVDPTSTSISLMRHLRPGGKITHLRSQSQCRTKANVGWPLWG